MYTVLKLVHIAAAVLSFGGFALRGYWMMRGSALLEARVVRIAPHVVDTLLLVSGVAIIATLNLEITRQPWLLAKLAALLVYIGFGTVALKRGRTRRIRTLAFVAAIATFAYIVGAAIGKSPWSWAG